MTNKKTIQQFDFPYPNDEKGYSLFSSELEEDENIAFHGTEEVKLAPIIENGFIITGELPSVSFAKKSSLALSYACNSRSEKSPDGVVIVVKFQELQLPEITVEDSIIYLYREDVIPPFITEVTSRG